MTEYSWAVNKLKLARAVAACGANATNPTEADIKAKYISYAGLVVEQGETLEEVVAKKVEEIKIKQVKNEAKVKETKGKKK
jgi:hypothetical protein